MAKIVTATPNPMLYFAAVFRVSSYKGAHANRGVTHPAVAAAFRLDAHPMQITGEGGATCKPNDRNPFVSKSDTALASKSVAICWAAPAFLSPRILLLSMQRWMWMRKRKRVRVQVWRCGVVHGVHAPAPDWPPARQHSSNRRRSGRSQSLQRHPKRQIRFVAGDHLSKAHHVRAFRRGVGVGADLRRRLLGSSGIEETQRSVTRSGQSHAAHGEQAAISRQRSAGSGCRGLTRSGQQPCSCPARPPAASNARAPPAVPPTPVPARLRRRPPHAPPRSRCRASNCLEGKGGGGGGPGRDPPGRPRQCKPA